MFEMLRHHLGPWLLVLVFALLAFAYALYQAASGWGGGGSPLQSIALGTVLLAASGWLLLRQLQRDLEG